MCSLPVPGTRSPGAVSEETGLMSTGSNSGADSSGEQGRAQERRGEGLCGWLLRFSRFPWPERRSGHGPRSDQHFGQRRRPAAFVLPAASAQEDP